MSVQAVLEWTWTLLGIGGLLFSVFVFSEAREDRRVVYRRAKREGVPPDPRFTSAVNAALAQEVVAIALNYGPGLTIAAFALMTPNPEQSQPLGVALSVLFNLIMLGIATKSFVRWHDRRFQLYYKITMDRSSRKEDRTSAAK